MKTTVIHHSADFDGLFCREIAKKFMPDAELIGWDFGDAPLSIPSGRIYVMDLPLDAPFGFKYKAGDMVAPQHPNGLVWIDHHRSSIESHPTSIPGYRIDGVAACRLAWQWFFVERHNAQNSTNEALQITLPDKQQYVERLVPEPLAVRLAGEYDIWDKRDPNAELFQHGLRSQPVNFQCLLEPEKPGCVPGTSYVDQLLEAGKVVEFVRKNEYADVIQQQGFDVSFEGLHFLACNSHELDIRSHLFEAGIKPEHDALVGFTFNGTDWRVSMYGVPGKPDIDLSRIAVKYGGGGHKQACGFRCAKLPFIN